jgi:hypothetical protein
MLRLFPFTVPSKARAARPWMLMVIAPIAGGFLVVTPAGAYALRSAAPASPVVLYENAPKGAERRDASNEAVQALVDDAAEPRLDVPVVPAGAPCAPPVVSTLGRPALFLCLFRSTSACLPSAGLDVLAPGAPRRGPPQR